MIELGAGLCGNLDSALSREWLETNGIGGFASATVAGANTRRYHGLLTAALQPPVGRAVLLSKLDETIIVSGETFELAVNTYPGAIHPEGYRFLTGFRLDPFPVFTYQAAGVVIEKRICMAQGENTTVVEYENLGTAPCTLELRPLLAFRDYHSLTRANGSFNGELAQSEGLVSVQPYATMPRLYFAHNAQSIRSEPHWYYNFEYSRERERGLDFTEDLFQPFVLSFSLPPGAKATVIASVTGSHSAADAQALIRRPQPPASPVNEPLVSDLMTAAGQFIVSRGENLHTVIAGYHWFSDWGRDTMIALPGLTLLTGRFEIARDILLAFSRAANEGMLPNRFADAGVLPEYNSVDASLWYFEAIRKFVQYTADYAFVRENLYATMKSILHSYTVGARYGIHCDEDGLIVAGNPGTQLTWMDAKIGDFVSTPRPGKPVEIQALWYNALRFTAALAHRFGEAPEEQRFSAMASKAQSSFSVLFWNETGGCFYDAVDGDFHDASLRPNQLLAFSLGFPIASRDRALQALATVERDLLTDFGLRTLARSDPKYRPQCAGSPFDRDSSYHQGTVWPWLLGPFITAYLRFQLPEDRPAAQQKALAWLARFPDHMQEAGIGTISEIFDGDAPHAPRGCIAQAWSVSEILRSLVEDIHGKLPAAKS